MQDSYVRKADGAAAVGGGTAAATAMAKEQANKTIGDATANIAAQDTARKAQVSDQHMKNVSALSQERQAIEQQKAQATSDAAQNMSNALFSAGVNRLGSQLEGDKGLKTNKLGDAAGANDNTSVTPHSVFDGTDAQRVNQETFARQMQGENGLPTNPLEKAVGAAIHRGSKW